MHCYIHEPFVTQKPVYVRDRLDNIFDPLLRNESGFAEEDTLLNYLLRVPNLQLQHDLGLLWVVLCGPC